jgi:hypothetical protein
MVPHSNAASMPHAFLCHICDALARQSFALGGAAGKLRGQEATVRIGDTIIVRDAFENRIARRVVGAEGDTVFVCTEEEYTAAKREGREPVCIGFNIKYVVGETTRITDQPPGFVTRSGRS